MSQKLITVYGATGAQGGSVVRALLRDKPGSFTIRGITRSPDSEAARALAAADVEIIKVNIFDKDELAAAFKGSWAVFVNTNSDDPVTLSSYITINPIGTDIIRLSDLPGYPPKRKWAKKEDIAKYAHSQPSLQSIVINPAYYMENFNVKEWAAYLGGLPFTEDSEGYYTLSWPLWGGSNEVPLIAIERDFGDIAISQSKTLEDIPADFEHATGKKSRFIPLEDWRLFKTDGTRVMQTVKEMFGFCYVSGGLYYGEPNDINLSASLKQAAAAAQGRSGEDTRLYSLGQYFKDVFA
ncbi:hypothetical protein CEP51_012807 [Fusarium floridanum]|uniref:NmrA-like domain-containing protein n=1 Tax=Fusarium floridanum TaxID=1325733 RepID=A0A428QM89_9HYPO|nr:hypothetical protein CEP51_012807 [Fusarium floridanum]